MARSKGGKHPSAKPKQVPTRIQPQQFMPPQPRPVAPREMTEEERIQYLRERYINESGLPDFWEQLPKTVALAKAHQEVVRKYLNDDEPGAIWQVFALEDLRVGGLGYVVEPPYDEEGTDWGYDEADLSIHQIEEAYLARAREIVAAHRDEIADLAASMVVSEEEAQTWLAPMYQLNVPRA